MTGTKANHKDQYVRYNSKESTETNPPGTLKTSSARKAHHFLSCLACDGDVPHGADPVETPVYLRWWNKMSGGANKSSSLSMLNACYSEHESWLHFETLYISHVYHWFLHSKHAKTFLNASGEANIPSVLNGNLCAADVRPLTFNIRYF